MLHSVPIGSIVFTWCVLVSVRPFRRPHTLAVASWASSLAPNELPFLFLVIVAVSTVPEVLSGATTSAGDRVALVLSVLAALGLLVIARRAVRTGAVVDEALAEGLGAGDRPRRPRWWARALLPVPVRPRDVERTTDIAYGDRGESNHLDVYRHRSRPAGAPTLIHLHGGRFRWGRKSREARPLLHRLARQGWTCISANYLLTPTPGEGFPQHLVDVKRVIAWARADGREHGIDPGAIFLAGSSAGAHLTAMAALTANDPTFQPGFEEADTSVAGGIGFYGYYGPLSDVAPLPTTPLAYTAAHAPPFFVVHGDNDTHTPVEGARELVEHLRATSVQPVVYAELPGAQHCFDLFHSIRYEAVIDAVESFTTAVRLRMPRRS